MVAGRNRSAERLVLEAERIAELVLQLRAEETRLRVTLERLCRTRRAALACLAATASAATARPTPNRRKRRKAKRGDKP